MREKSVTLTKWREKTLDEREMFEEKGLYLVSYLGEYFERLR